MPGMNNIYIGNELRKENKNVLIFNEDEIFIFCKGNYVEIERYRRIIKK